MVRATLTGNGIIRSEFRRTAVCHAKAEINRSFWSHNWCRICYKDSSDLYYNQLDGFSGNSGVIVLAATNRPDVLDSALLRPGRFNRQVTVDRPDVAGRVRILQVHSRGKSLAKDVDFDKIARRTPGFTEADLQNLMNEAAILAARREVKEISKDEISDALERILSSYTHIDTCT